MPDITLEFDPERFYWQFMSKHLKVFQDDLHSQTVTQVADAFIQMRNAVSAPSIHFICNFQDVIP